MAMLSKARAVTEKPLIRRNQYSAIAAMWMVSIIVVKITSESVKGEEFCDFLG